MSADCLNELRGLIEPHGALAEASHTLASVGMARVARTIPFEIDASAEPALLDESHADGSVDRSQAILKVDDDVDVLRSLAEAMDSSVDLVSVESLTEARLEIKARPFDLVALGLELGAESGLNLIPRLHDLDHHTIPVIVYSARCADLACGAEIKVTLDKSQTSIDALLASLFDRLALLPLHAR